MSEEKPISGNEMISYFGNRSTEVEISLREKLEACENTLAEIKKIAKPGIGGAGPAYTAITSIQNIFWKRNKERNNAQTRKA